MHSKIHWALAVVLAAGAGSAAAEPADWVRGTLDDACDVTDLDFSDARHGFATCMFSDVMVTGDAGVNWHVIHTDLAQTLRWARAASDQVLYAARLGFYRSDDRGQTWSELGGLSSSDDSIFDAHFFDAQHVSLLKGADLYYSENGGESWDMVYQPPQNVFFDKLHFPNADIGFATGGISSSEGTAGFVARTADGGRSWTLLDFHGGRIYASDFFDADHGIVATQDSNLYTTVDGGGSWQLLGAAPNGDLLLDIAHRDASHWYAVSATGGLYETRDGGVTWETGYQTPDYDALAAVTIAADGAVVAGGNSGVLVYENRVFRDGFD
ncbi:hypothetical protein [Dokdonella sp.]|uniref:WD40/YVTN/BNR-like repeat-containing protein n=1 Tax=Dokdonella sp. TaxID=2291710 RepID=UPI001B1E0F93|nr:hypothetical protein [Dokdonella sp.]MBO9662321.1 hypothetical protein [Dokdonella sp.]